MAFRMYFLRAGGHVTVTGPAKPLHGREIQVNNRTMRHGAIHHNPTADLVARQLILTVRTSRARALVEIELDLSSDFFEVDSPNDIPLEGR
jgi:hypothetical protein